MTKITDKNELHKLIKKIDTWRKSVAELTYTDCGHGHGLRSKGQWSYNQVGDSVSGFVYAENKEQKKTSAMRKIMHFISHEREPQLEAFTVGTSSALEWQ